MRAGIRRASTWLAIYVVAAHAVLAGFGPAFSAAQPSAFDPFAVTCLTGAVHPVAGDAAGGLPDSAPGQACDHCVLCGVVGAVPPSLAIVIAFRPAQVEQRLTPASEAAPVIALFDPTFARGPPLRA